MSHVARRQSPPAALLRLLTALFAEEFGRRPEVAHALVTMPGQYRFGLVGRAFHSGRGPSHSRFGCRACCRSARFRDILRGPLAIPPYPACSRTCSGWTAKRHEPWSLNQPRCCRGYAHSDRGGTGGPYRRSGRYTSCLEGRSEGG